MGFSDSHERGGTPIIPFLEWADRYDDGLLDRFESGLLESLSRTSSTIRDIVKPFLGAGGKRLRPYLVLVSGSFGQPHKEALITAGVAVELVHTASLLHDDIMDQSAFRRGVPALHRVHGARAAVFVGAHLLHLANSLLQGLTGVSAETHRRLKEIAALATADVCSGQFRESLNIGNMALTEDEYLQIIELKTARLFEASCQVGAIIGGMFVEPLRDYGRNLGLLYQVADDLRDILGHRPELHRPPGGDFNEGTYTLPVIHALGGDDLSAHRLKQILGSRQGALSPQEVGEVLTALVGSKGIDAAWERALAFGDAAKQSIASLPRTSAYDVLTQLIDVLLADLALLVEHTRSQCVRA